MVSDGSVMCSVRCGEVPARCIKTLFRALVEEGEAIKAKELVEKFGGDQSCCFVEELVSALVSSGDLARAIELSSGNLQGCSAEMKALIDFLRGGSAPEQIDGVDADTMVENAKPDEGASKSPGSARA
jgi:hypothetical protein